MHNEDTGEEVSCPYCDEIDDCPHLLATIDKTFGQIGSGYAFDRQDELTQEIERSFIARALSGEKSSVWNDAWLSELWDYAISEFKPDEPDIYLEIVPLFDLISDIFEEADAIEISGVFEGGPGMSSALSSYYCKEPEVSFERAIEMLKGRLEPA